MSAADDMIVEAMGVPYAREGLARLREAGFDVVPREPTDAMLDAGGKSEPFVEPGNGPNGLWHPGEIVAATVWRAMVEAVRADPVVAAVPQEVGPGFWAHETSGVLRPAVEAYLGGTPLTEEQVAAIRAYLRQWIAAPVFHGDAVDELRGHIDGLTSREAIAAWLRLADKAGIEPL